MTIFLNSLALLATTPLQRWAYARQFSSKLVHSTWFWSILAGTFTLVVVVYVVGRFLSRRVQVVPKRSEFDVKADRLGLGQDERVLLARIAQLSGLRHAEAIYNSDAAFDQGVTRVLQSPQVAAMTQPMRERTCELLGLLRDRLGYRKSADVEDITPSSTRQMALGQMVSVLKHRGSGTLEGTLVRKKQAAMVMELTGPAQAAAGDIWLIRYSDGRSTWEFEAPVIGASGNEVMLGHAEQLRFVNRRRFPRVPTMKPARVAPFPFASPCSAEQAAAFSDGTLTEIAGPGLLVKAEMEAKLGDRVLVVTEIEPNKVLEGVGKVRRVEPQEQSTLLAIELLGLGADEIAELSRQTTLAAKAAQMPLDDESPPPARPAAQVASPPPQAVPAGGNP